MVIDVANMVERRRSVLLLSEESVFAVGVKTILAAAGLELVHVSDYESALEYFHAIQPALLLIDFAGEDKFDMILRAHALIRTCPVAVFVREIQVEAAYQMLKFGMKGIVPKNLAADSMVAAVLKILEGGVWCDEKLASNFMKAKAIPLSAREGQLVSLVSQGLKNKEIASVLTISEATVRVYLSALFRKLGLKDRYELAIHGMKNMANKAPRFGGGDEHWERLRCLLIDQTVKPLESEIETAPAPVPIRRAV